MASYGTNIDAQVRASFAFIDQDAAFRRIRGVIAETVPAAYCGATGLMATGVAVYVGVVLPAGTIVTNINTYVAVAGSGITVSKTGLFDKNGIQLAVSADQGTNWQSAGFKTIAMATPYVVPAMDVYYCGILSVFSTTGPTIPRGSAGNGLTGFVVGSNPAAYYAQSGLADMPSPATFATPSTGNQLAFYMNIT